MSLCLNRFGRLRALGLVGASLWHGILQRGGKRERAGSGIELKTFLGNKKKTGTQTWHWVIRKRQTHTHLAFESTAQT